MTIVVFLVILGLLVLVHEAGHFITAKLFKVGVDEFAIGFPPRVASVTKKGTAFSLNAIPIGGYVKIKGENDDNRDPDSFLSKSRPKRATILVAGVAMNVVFAYVLFAIGFTAGTPSVIDGLPRDAVVTEKKLQIVSVSESTPAFDAGLRTEDQIIAVNDVSVENVSQFRSVVQPLAQTPIPLTYIRDGTQHTVSLTPVPNDSGQGIIGVGLVDTGNVRYPFFAALREAGRMVGTIIAQIFVSFWSLIRNIFIQHPVPLDVAGPVGIAVLTGQVVKLGFLYIVQFTALLSLNLAVINVLPIPALDGGRLLFLGIESLRRKPISRKIESAIHSIGFAMLVGLIIYVTVKDVGRFSNSINAFFQRVL